ncbi:hypothetical protein B5D82_07130 [Cognaticolwellia beringensis]|uniref:Uncharacterized protein n=1 Tax=Cognaticolwellia beringensis TaxID=1967665 RepID=A0A222G6M0_9GAMM|nr:hypothetical protein B5D82_07130 [Cognaticolwellia beringensis]
MPSKWGNIALNQDDGLKPNLQKIELKTHKQKFGNGCCRSAFMPSKRRSIALNQDDGLKPEESPQV